MQSSWTRAGRRDPSDVGLRILYVSAEYLPHTGGTEVHTHEVARRLVEAGHEATVLTTNRGGELPATEQIDGVRVRRVPRWLGSNDYYIAPAIYSAVRAARPSVVHCQGCHTLVAPLAMLAARRAGIPYVVTFHSGGHSSVLRSRLRPLQWRLQRPLFAGASRLVGVSAFEANLFERILDLPTERFAVVPNGVDFPREAEEEEVARDPDQIVSVGRLERYKGHQHVLHALPEVLAKRPSARLLVLGAGPYKHELQALVRGIGLEDRVSFRAIPATARADLACLLRRSSVVVSMSEYEAHSISVIEAAHLGCALVVADATGLHELVEAGLARGVDPSAGRDELAAAILEQLEDPLVSPRMVLPTWQDCSDRLLEIYGSIASPTAVRAA